MGVVAGFLVNAGRASDETVALSANYISGEAVAPLDQLSSVDIAVNVARMANLTEAVAVTNQSDSAKVATAIAPSDAAVVAKPQIVATSVKSVEDVQQYTVQDGDTVSSLASKFGITSDSIRWSNGLTGERLTVGKVLTIPPVSGIVYTVLTGDTAESLATKFKVTQQQIIAFNDAELTGLSVGSKIVIPGGQQPAPAVAASSSYAFSGGTARYGYNGYDYGYCTWYVANKRLAAGASMPTNLGNAATWGVRARAYGLPTGSTPAVGAAVVTSTRGAGHVAYVEVVNGDGSIWISEMNSRGQVSINDSSPAGGWNRVDWKLVPADRASGYTYVY